MVMPVADQAAQQIRAPQERGILCLLRTQYKMVATTGAGMTSVHHELLGGEPAFVGVGVQGFGLLHHFVPGPDRLHIHFDHPRVRGDPEMGDPVVRGWLVALQQYRLLESCSGFLDG